MNKFEINDIPDVYIERGQVNNINIKKSGNFWILNENELPWMYYNPKNKRDLQEQYAMYDLAYGKILITGFGFGILLNWLCKKSEISEITIIEKHKEVIDLYLRHNELPSNKTINIIYEDANTYQTNEKYDCLFLDHLDWDPDMIGTSRKIGSNIAHDVMWFWPLEQLFLQKIYKCKMVHDYFMFPDMYPDRNFKIHWKEYRQSLNIPTIPELSENEIEYYVKVFANDLP